MQSLVLDKSKNVLISGLTSLNSELIHMSIQNSERITLRNLKISAPSSSPNTDGIHIQSSTGITITKSTIGTGDDCISMKAGVANAWIEGINCGPGHGIRYVRETYYHLSRYHELLVLQLLGLYFIISNKTHIAALGA